MANGGADASQGEGWWQASDGKWYPPQTASPSIPPPPPPQTPSSPPVEDDGGDGSDKPPFWRRRWVLITGGILIVLIVIPALTDTSGDDESDTVLELAAAEDEPDESPATPTETTATTSESRAATTTEAPLVGESSLDSPIQLGAVVQVGSWRLRVSAITPDGTDEVMEEYQFNDPPPEGNQFFIASLEATYTGTESSTFRGDMRLKSVGDSRVAYETYDASCGVIPDDIDDSGETFPGGTITGNVCWSIQSTDAASLVMIVEESANFDDTRAFLSLDPTATPINETALTPATSTAPSTVTEAEEATLEPQGTPTIEEALLQFTLCQRLRVTVQMRWGQAPATIYADDPKVWGNLEEGDYVQFISGVQDNGVVGVKVFPHDGRAVGNTNDQVWIDWKGLTQNRLDQHALECED